MSVTPEKTLKAAQRVRDVEYAVRDVLLWADAAERAGRDMIYLNIGDPCQFGFETPPELIETTHRAMLENRNGYGPADGVE